MSLQWAKEPEVGLPRPDICIFLDIAPEVAAQRGGYGTEKYEMYDMQLRVRELFYRLRYQLGYEDIVPIDAARSPDDVQCDILKAVTDALTEEKMASPLRRLQP